MIKALFEQNRSNKRRQSQVNMIKTLFEQDGMNSRRQSQREIITTFLKKTDRTREDNDNWISSKLCLNKTE
jgi:hypothetical protein